MLLSRPGRDRIGHARQEWRGGWTTSSGTRESILFHHAPSCLSPSVYTLFLVSKGALMCNLCNADRNSTHSL